MSDAPQGPGWWQASDGKWYPPEQAPGAQPTPPTPPVGPSAYAGAPGAAGAGRVEVGAAISYGWNKFTQYVGQLVLILVVLVVVNVVFNGLSQTSDSLALQGVLSLVGFLLSMIIQLGVVRVALDVTAGRAPEASQLFQTDRLGPYIIASILYGLAIFVGFFALCIGAFVAAFFLYFYPFFILDRNQDPVQSLKSSFELVKSDAGNLLLLALVAMAITAISCGILSPVAWFAAAYAYRTLNGQAVAP